MPTVLFTKETAGKFAKKSHEPMSARFVRPVEPDNESQEAEKFRLHRLSIVRAQLAKLDKMMAEEMDAAKLDRIASAQARCAEQERQLSGRSLPPTIKPSTKPERRRSTTYAEPVPQAPEPIPTPQAIVSQEGFDPGI